MFETVLAAYGISVEFEQDYASPPPFRFQTGEMNFQEAVRGLETAANSLVLPLTATSALVVRDTPQRRNDSMPVVTISIPIPERMAVQEAQEIMQAAQQILELKHVALDAGKRLVTIREIPSKVQAAQALFSDLSRLRAQVEVEVELVSVDKNSSLALGLSLPTSSSIIDFGRVLGNAPKVAANIATFGGGASLIGLGIGDAAALATLTKSKQTQTLTSRVITVDGQAGAVTIGDRYPFITSGYYGGTTSGGSVRPPPTISFEDLGLTLKVTPTVHEKGEMSLEIEAAFKVLAGQAVNEIPVVANRKYQGKVRLGDGQWAVVAGLTKLNESVTSGGMSIPGLSSLFRNRTVNRASGETLILIKPRLINLPPWEVPTHSIWYGSESRPLSVF